MSYHDRRSITAGALGCLGTAVYWLAALFLSVGFIMGDCDGAACLAAKDRTYTIYWIVAASLYLVLAIGFWLSVRNRRNGADE